MRVSKDERERNKRQILGAAERLFRRRGFDGVGVADLMKAAGFTHGGFYNHFSGKDELEREASGAALSRANAALARRIAAGGWKSYVQEYLSKGHRDDPATGCTLAALAPDAGRKGPALQDRFARAIEEVVSALGERPGAKKGKAREEAMRALSELVGALILSRAVAGADPALSGELLAAARRGLAGAPRLR